MLVVSPMQSPLKCSKVDKIDTKKGNKTILPELHRYFTCGAGIILSLSTFDTPHLIQVA